MQSSHRPWIALSVFALALPFACSRRTVVVAPSSCPLHAEGGGPPVELAGDSRLLEEAERELHAARSTRYQHATEVDEESGSFAFDCSGFLTYALRIAAPRALSIVPVGPKGRPRAQEFVSAFLSAPPIEAHASSPWARVARIQDVRPGDVIGWMRADDAEGDATGHVTIAASRPTCIESDVAKTIDGGVQEWTLRVIDSSKSGHAEDTRGKDASGLGEGTLGLVVDENGALLGYRWKGGKSPKAHATTIAAARLVNP